MHEGLPPVGAGLGKQVFCPSPGMAKVCLVSGQGQAWGCGRVSSRADSIGLLFEEGPGGRWALVVDHHLVLV